MNQSIKEAVEKFEDLFYRENTGQEEWIECPYSEWSKLKSEILQKEQELKKEIKILKKDQKFDWKDHATYEKNWRKRLEIENIKLKKDIERLKDTIKTNNIVCSKVDDVVVNLQNQLKEQRKKIEDRIKELKGLIRRGIIHFDDSIYYEKLIKELKNLLESEKFDRAMGLNPIIRRNPHLSNSENKERRKEEVK